VDSALSRDQGAQKDVPHGRRRIPEWWEPQVVPETPAGYVEMIDQARLLLDALAAAVPDEGTVAHVTGALRDLTERLAEDGVDEFHQLSGRVEHVPGRGQLVVPPATIEHVDHLRIECSVTFTRHFLGGNGAVHGGALPLLFDDILGRFAQIGGRPIARTAYLHVDYRAITPVNKQLRLVGEIVSEQGRKRLVRATLEDGDTLCAEAEGLFVALRPGQP
jgi:acyl-coenzyme A thioesterase PaaI-like protein